MRFRAIPAVAAFGALAVMLALAMAASAEAPSTAPGQNKLQCFDGVTDGLGFSGTRSRGTSATTFRSTRTVMVPPSSSRLSTLSIALA